MNNIHILDCTLRDGGYCNEWTFGFDNVKKITNGLQEAGIEIIECGFITNRVSYNPDVTRFNTLEEIAKVIPKNKDGKIFVAMMNYGEYSVDDLPPYDGTSIDGIRVAFHKKNLDASLTLCKQIKEKGYLVFVQAMVSLAYSDEEFLKMIWRVNEFKPYAFYIVDSFGMMKAKDLTRLFYVVEHNLDEETWIGFHSHNNMQLAYSNAQTLTCMQTNRNLIIDSSVYGMGRGAGNLNTELFLEYLNENAGKCYELKPVFILIDEILNDIYHKKYWGYSLPNYISASHYAHPNYAGYLDDKKTLTIEGMNDIFDMMDEDKKVSYDKEYIEELYLRYMMKENELGGNKIELFNRLHDSEVLLVAPGRGSIKEKDKILALLSSNALIVISINHYYPYVETDYIFLSNQRRFKELNKQYYGKSIITSNIHENGVFCKVNYTELLNEQENVRDNAGLMAVKFLISQQVKKIYLAGFDGYNYGPTKNYADSQMELFQDNSRFDEVNKGMSIVLSEFSKQVSLEYVTNSRFGYTAIADK